MAKTPKAITLGQLLTVKAGSPLAVNIMAVDHSSDPKGECQEGG